MQVFEFQDTEEQTLLCLNYDFSKDCESDREMAFKQSDAPKMSSASGTTTRCTLACASSSPMKAQCRSGRSSICRSSTHPCR